MNRALFMRKWISIILILAGSAPVLARSEESSASQFQAILDGAVDEGIMAVSAYISWDNGTWSGTAGQSSADSADSLSTDSLFRLASITKLFTATIILQLVDEDLLALDDTLVDHLSESPAADIPYAESVTIAMLLNHSSGIRSFTDVQSFWGEAYEKGGLDRTWKPEDLIRYAIQKKPHFKPGTTGKTQYSNSNYILLGMVIEKVTGKSLAHAYRSRIYAPLEMNNTLLEGYDPGISSVQHSFMKSGPRTKMLAKRRKWNKPGKGDLYDVSGNYKLYNSWAWSAGAISSTTGDLNRFLNGVRDGSLLSKESQDILFRNNSATGNAGVVFGGSGGWDGISTSAYTINNEVQIIVLINTTGFTTNANTLRGKLYRVLRPLE